MRTKGGRVEGVEAEGGGVPPPSPPCAGRSERDVSSGWVNRTVSWWSAIPPTHNHYTQAQWALVTPYDTPLQPVKITRGLLYINHLCTRVQFGLEILRLVCKKVFFKILNGFYLI